MALHVYLVHLICACCTQYALADCICTYRDNVYLLLTVSQVMK